MFAEHIIIKQSGKEQHVFFILQNCHFWSWKVFKDGGNWGTSL